MNKWKPESMSVSMFTSKKNHLEEMGFAYRKAKQTPLFHRKNKGTVG